jgi:alanine racemase
VRVHIKLDTGLGRNGVREPDWPAMFTLASDYEARGYLEVRGFMSHFSGTSDSDDAEQIAAFDRATALAETFGLQPSLRHLAATAGALRFPEARYDATRLGIALYGLDPIAPDARCGLELRPALTLTAHVRRYDVDDMPRWLLDVGQVDGLLPVAEGELLLQDEAGDRWRLERVDACHCVVTPLGDVERSAHRRVTVIGGTASADDWAAAYGLADDTRAPAVLRSELAQIKRVHEGQGVSYGYEWHASETTTIGLVPVGYADAIPRSAAHRAELLVRETPAPLVGRVAMDQVVVNLGDRDGAPGEPVRLWGPRPSDFSLQDWAGWTGLCAEGLVAGLGTRVQRRSARDNEAV